jgi:alpha-D-xyloside xylohydrolase
VDDQADRRGGPAPPEKGWSPDQQRWLFLHRYAYPLGSVRSQDRTAAFASFDLHYDERVYGFGESFGQLVKNGTWQQLWVQETFSNATPASYKQVPFWVSTRGAGIYVNTSNALGVHVGDLEHSALSVTVEDTDALDFFVIAGPSLKEILPRYTSLTGAPAVPPQWSFGLWMSRITYRSQDEVEAVAARLREHRIPCDVLHIDTGWFREEYVCDLEFDPDRFPDVAGMTSRLRELGIRVSLWQWPNVNVDSSMFPEGLAGGHLARRESGHVYLQAGGYGQDAGVIDFSSPAAVEWVQEKYARLFDQGIAAIKVDYGEGAPPDAVYAGVESTSMHNLYPLLYGKTVWDATVAAPASPSRCSGRAPPGPARSATRCTGPATAWPAGRTCRACCARCCPSGCPASRSTATTSAASPAGRARSCTCAGPSWASSPRTSGRTAPGSASPWHYGEHVQEEFRRYAELRYRCCPTCGPRPALRRDLAADGAADGAGLPGRPDQRDVDDQYLLGESLLVAPCWTSGTAAGCGSRRRLGRLLDRRGRHRPVHRVVDAPLEVLPLYVRAGAVLPMGPVQQHTAERPLDPLTLHVYAPAASPAATPCAPTPATIAVTYRRDGASWTSPSRAPGRGRRRGARRARARGPGERRDLRPGGRRRVRHRRRCGPRLPRARRRRRGGRPRPGPGAGRSRRRTCPVRPWRCSATCRPSTGRPPRSRPRSSTAAGSTSSSATPACCAPRRWPSGRSRPGT